MEHQPSIRRIPLRDSWAAVHTLEQALRHFCMAVALLFFASPATGQVAAPVPPAAGGAPIQPPAPARLLRPWHIVPSLSVSETYSDNVTLAVRGAARSDRVTNLSPGIRFEGSGPRVRGHFDYGLHRILYAADPRLNNSQNALDSLMTVEMLENQFFIDTRANISQQSRSAFAAAAPDATSATGNRVETSVYQLAPYIRGRISDVAAYQLRLNATHSSSRGIASSGTSTTEWSGNMHSAAVGARIGWALDGSARAVHNVATGDSQFTRARGSLDVMVNPEFHVSAYDGLESTEVAGAAGQTSRTPGIGVSWSPADRTQLTALREKRFFGPANTFKLSHRMARTALTYSEDKEVSVVPNLTPAASQALATSGQPGTGTAPGVLQDATAAAGPGIATIGQPVAAGTAAGFAIGRATVRRNRQGSVTVLGINNTVTLTWSAQDQQAVGIANGAADSFSVSSSIRSQVLGATWMHTVSALTTMTVLGSRTSTKGLTGAAATLTTQDNLSATLLRRLSARTSVSVGSRHTRFSSTIAGEQRENAVLATLSTHF